jgi:hypothetical protein
MRRWYLLLPLGLVMLSCTPPVATCVPGQTSACFCLDGKVGAQQCLGDGTFEECQCRGGVEVDQGGGVADLRDPNPTDPGDMKTEDLRPSDDLRPADEDLRMVPVDMIMPADMTMLADMIMPIDMIMPVDMSVPDMTMPVDMSVPDMTMPDLAVPRDMAMCMATKPVGDTCTRACECTGPSSRCLAELDFGAPITMPGRYCSNDACDVLDSATTCGTGGVCVDPLFDGNTLCLKRCMRGGCRMDYACVNLRSAPWS